MNGCWWRKQDTPLARAVLALTTCTQPLHKNSILKQLHSRKHQASSTINSCAMGRDGAERRRE